jgi:hypothetical protein
MRALVGLPHATARTVQLSTYAPTGGRSPPGTAPSMLSYVELRTFYSSLDLIYR